MNIIRYIRIPITVFALSWLMWVQGCNKDENSPVLTLSGTNLVEGIYTTNDSGELSINVSVTAPNGFKVLP